jgi:DnaJ homolog subfamily C member 8
MYVHPDKNKDDKERSEKAFEAVNKAYKMLEEEKERKRCLEVVDEARERVDKMITEKRKKAPKDSKTGESRVEEDDPDKYRHAIYVMTCKLFADVERLKVREAEKKQEEK